ncbi:MAG: IclR family transcriptional regulator [Desulfomonilaceae bacterium]
MASKREPASAKPQYSSVVPAVEQASRILLALAQAPVAKMSLTEICNEVGIHKSKGYSILNTLHQFAFVQRSPHDKTYSLGLGLLFLANRALSGLDIREVAGPFLQELSRKTNSTAFLGMVSENHVFVVARDEGTQEIGLTIRLGHRFPIAWGAHGKAIVAFLPDAEQEKVLGSTKVYFHGGPSKFDPHRLELEIADCRKAGFAVDLGEMKIGINAVASPVFGPGGRLIGSMAIVGTFPKEFAINYGADTAAAAKRFSELIGGAPHVGAGHADTSMFRTSQESVAQQED